MNENSIALKENFVVGKLLKDYDGISSLVKLYLNSKTIDDEKVSMANSFLKKFFKLDYFGELNIKDEKKIGIFIEIHKKIESLISSIYIDIKFLKSLSLKYQTIIKNIINSFYKKILLENKKFTIISDLPSFNKLKPEWLEYNDLFDGKSQPQILFQEMNRSGNSFLKYHIDEIISKIKFEDSYTINFLKDKFKLKQNAEFNDLYKYILIYPFYKHGDIYEKNYDGKEVLRKLKDFIITILQTIRLIYHFQTNDPIVNDEIKSTDRLKFISILKSYRKNIFSDDSLNENIITSGIIKNFDKLEYLKGYVNIFFIFENGESGTNNMLEEKDISIINKMAEILVESDSFDEKFNSWFNGLDEDNFFHERLNIWKEINTDNNEIGFIKCQMKYFLYTILLFLSDQRLGSVKNMLGFDLIKSDFEGLLYTKENILDTGIKNIPKEANDILEILLSDEKYDNEDYLYDVFDKIDNSDEYDNSINEWLSTQPINIVE